MRRGAAGLSNDPFTNGPNQSRLFRQRNERGWRDHPLFGMPPPYQGLQAADLAAGDVDDGLIVQFELAGQQRVAQILLESTSRLHLDVHFRFEEAQGAAPVALGAIEGQIRVPDQLFRQQAIGWGQGYAHARADDDLMAIDLVRFAQCCDDALSKRRRPPLCGR